jgi:type I restriction enzyme M protein
MWVAGGMISGKPLPDNAKNFAQNKIYGIDFNEKAVKIAKAINLIVGDGKSHVYKDNSLAPHTWSDETKSGLRGRLLRFPSDPVKDRENQEKFLFFDFDVLMTNPPFAGTVKERDILRLYKLAEKNGRLVDKIGRHILFLERSLQFLKPGGRMAIVLPQGLLNNTSAEYIRRFIIDEARILAVVGLHVNTFKPHTGTKTSVLFLRKYTEEEKQKIQQIRLKYESEWEKFLENLKEKYQHLSWDSPVDEEDVPEELKSFLETYFEGREEIEELPVEVEETEATEEENRGKKPLAVLIQEKSELEEVLREKEEELQGANAGRKAELKKEIKALQKKIDKLIKEISQRTLAGQISLVLNDERITEAFKKYWLDGKVMQEMDYPIFFAINEKPVKDESGEYRYKKNPDGSFVLDEHGHPVIDHDLDEIAEAFIKFAKEQLAKGDNHFDFWR